MMKGCYTLVIEIPERKVIKIASKGKIEFEKGYYVYVGSAMNGLEARVKRHLSKTKKLHWHIDYLLRHANVIEIIYNLDKKVECDISQKLVKKNDFIKGFGCSDCMCESHLYYFKSKNDAIEAVTNAYESIKCEFKTGISDFKQD